MPPNKEILLYIALFLPSLAWGQQSPVILPGAAVVAPGSCTDSDDSGAIQKALNAAQVVYLSPGCYALANPLTITQDGAVIFGYGVTLRVTTAATAVTVDCGSGGCQSGVSFYGLTLVYAGMSKGGVGIAFGSSSSVEYSGDRAGIYDVSVTGFDTQISFSGWGNVRSENVYLAGGLYSTGWLVQQIGGSSNSWHLDLYGSCSQAPAMQGAVYLSSGVGYSIDYGDVGGCAQNVVLGNGTNLSASAVVHYHNVENAGGALAAVLNNSVLVADYIGSQGSWNTTKPLFAVHGGTLLLTGQFPVASGVILATKDADGIVRAFGTGGLVTNTTSGETSAADVSNAVADNAVAPGGPATRDTCQWVAGRLGVADDEYLCTYRKADGSFATVNILNQSTFGFPRR